MRKDGKLRIEEVAVLVGVSVKTINNWYSFKKQNPGHELASALPEFTQDRNRGTRLWTRDNVPLLVRFKNMLPQGRAGVMGSVTQKYYHKKKEDNNGED